MQMSRRARRMEQHHKRGKQTARLNMVSLMDIFTILVFFLLVSSSESESVPSSKVLVLPESIASEKPKENLIILITGTDILVQGRAVASLEDAIQSEETIIDDLKKELDHQAKRSSINIAEVGGDITIMGDRELPYKLLKKIMVTCTSANYVNISLATIQKAIKKS